MGVKEKYYYFKPKSPTAAKRATSGLAASGEMVFRGKAIAAEVAATSARTVLDMGSLEQASGRIGAVSFFRAFLIPFLAGLLYIGGLVISAGATGIRDHITDLSLRGMDKLAAGGEALAGQDTLLAKSHFIAAENLFTAAQQEVLALGQTNLYLSGLAADRSRIIAGQQLIDSGVNLAQAGQLLIASTEPLLQYINGDTSATTPLDQTTVALVNTLSASRPQLDSAIAKVDKANSLLTNINPQVVGEAYAQALLEGQQKTGDLQTIVHVLGLVAQELPDVLGFKNPRSYMILNQNDSELRPTGGFLGSVTLVEIYKGELTDVRVDDAYRIDGQIVGPFNQEKVFPNANFEPDFKTSATYLESLYEKSGGGSMDGIIAVNTQFMSRLMQIIGDIHLPSRDIVITPDRFAQIVHEEIDAAVGTSSPKAILSEILPILTARLMSLTSEQVEQLKDVLLHELTAKNVVVSSRNDRLQALFENLNWAGQVLPESQGQDYLMVVRANMGARKSSHSVVEQIEHTANLNLAGELEDELKLTYVHTGSDVYPDGLNQEFIRAYVPKGAVVSDIIGHEEDLGWTIQDAYDKSMITFWVKTAPGETREVVIHYALPTLELVGDRYELLVQKQPGANTTRLISTVRVSPALKFTDGSKAKRLFEDSLASDVKLGVDFIHVD